MDVWNDSPAVLQSNLTVAISLGVVLLVLGITIAVIWFLIERSKK
jgi:hypothetical protein